MPTISFLEAFADAWNRHDLDAIMAHMAEDGVFVSSNGTKAEGAVQVRETFRSVLDSFPDVSFDSASHFVSGDRGVSEWTFSGTDAEDGSIVDVRGCDIFTFGDGKIVLKDTYLK
jgi:ketosteroid isomerase-like protein